MKIYHNINILISSSILCMLCFVGGCSTANVTSINSEDEVNTAQTSVITDSSEGNENQTTGEGDCYIPLPEKKKQITKGTMDLKTEAGIPIKVTVTNYEPIEDFFFTMKPSNTAQAKGQSGVFLQLESISEFKVNRKIFGYIIYTLRPKSGNHSNSSNGVNANSREARLGAFRCYDLDGDGKFEYPTDDGSERPTVPMWVIQ